MSKFKQQALAFIRDEEGLTMVEYAVAGGLILVGAVAAFSTVGFEVDRVIDLIGAELTGIV
ncbi:MAG: Flp family type IVb pilin [Gammaproteobacteria bacterium]|jgi:pilus assembly protein Flp/PilA|nr:Flp family type IVb pilin [Gammaproteobacteria bacterium]